MNDQVQSSRCDTYCTFKSLLNVEKYLCIDISFYFRKSFARFRCSSHKLNIELGRHYGIERADRTCFYCLLNGNNQIFQEYHALFICPKYSIVRENYLFNWYCGRTETVDFINLMKINNCKKLKLLMIFITKLMREIDDLQEHLFHKT